MMSEHLTDEQIQDYLDENLSQEQKTIIERHIQTCQKCQTELAQYRNLYTRLKSDVTFDLSPGFSIRVMKTIRAEARKAFLARLWNLLLPVLGIAVGIGAMIYYVDFKPFVKIFADSLNPARYVDSAVVSNLNQILVRLNVNLNLIVFAGLSLLVVILIDQLLSRHKEKFFSYMKILPVM